jgi:chromosome transmission fidelity protein 4
MTLGAPLGPLSSKPKEKERKELTRQSTLFGLPLGPPMEKPEKRGRKKKVTEDSSQSETPEGGSKTGTPTPESAPLSSMPASDVTMVEAEAPSEATLVETQQLEEAYETQVDSQDVQDSMNEVFPSALLMVLVY